jgi:hypothetical protein
MDGGREGTYTGRLSSSSRFIQSRLLAYGMVPLHSGLASPL